MTPKTNSYRFYTGTKKPAGEGESAISTIPFPTKKSLEDYPENYSPDQGLIEAVNLAIIMNQPLLLTGDPGAGKTQLAYHVAYTLGLGKPEKFETRSTSQARDLFYYFNSVGLFNAANNKDASKRPADYITYNALGLAILKSNKLDESMAKYLPPDIDWKNHVPKKSVVLIDEVDKAPRDFPNDILNQIENLYFRIPELENKKIEADLANAPITIITSNSERNLPNAFLRRCIFYHINFPKPAALEKILYNRLKDLSDEHTPPTSKAFISEAVQLFIKLCEKNSPIKKKPSTAEMIVWFDALRRLSNINDNPIKDGTKLLDTLGSVVKENEDTSMARIIVKDWLRSMKYSFTDRDDETISK